VPLKVLSNPNLPKIHGESLVEPLTDNKQEKHPLRILTVSSHKIHIIPRLNGSIGNQIYQVLSAYLIAIVFDLTLILPNYEVNTNYQIDNRRQRKYYASIFTNFKTLETTESNSQISKCSNVITLTYDSFDNIIAAITAAKNEDACIYVTDDNPIFHISAKIFELAETPQSILHKFSQQFNISTTIHDNLKNKITQNGIYENITIQVRLGDNLISRQKQIDFYCHFHNYYKYVLDTYFSETDRYTLVIISDSPEICKRLSFWKGYRTVILDYDDVTCWKFGLISDNLIVTCSSFGCSMCALNKIEGSKQFMPRRFRTDEAIETASIFFSGGFFCIPDKPTVVDKDDGANAILTDIMSITKQEIFSRITHTVIEMS